ncbi:hypothetical protein RA272_29315, partial [Pseudomonas syringae pv. tagetis]|uniref:hypothetical protein n=1 Tax=Pseudomonas syringae group genomosp. 7 TaxID=251699 RepID=UPI0037706C9C
LQEIIGLYTFNGIESHSQEEWRKDMPGIIHNRIKQVIERRDIRIQPANGIIVQAEALCHTPHWRPKLTVIENTNVLKINIKVF